MPPGPWALSCSHCSWNTREIGIEFEKPVQISQQLAKMKNKAAAPLKDVVADEELDRKQQFANLRSFYASQLNQSDAPSTPFDLSENYGSYGSPDALSLSRLVNMYTGVSSSAKKAAKEKAQPMREAFGTEEGMKIIGDEEYKIIERMKTGGWEGSMWAAVEMVSVRS